jgi:hypothetical protein
LRRRPPMVAPASSSLQTTSVAVCSLFSIRTAKTAACCVEFCLQSKRERDLAHSYHHQKHTHHRPRPRRRRHRRLTPPPPRGQKRLLTQVAALTRSRARARRRPRARSLASRSTASWPCAPPLPPRRTRTATAALVRRCRTSMRKSRNSCSSAPRLNDITFKAFLWLDKHKKMDACSSVSERVGIKQANRMGKTTRGALLS